MPLTRKAYRAAILHSIADPAEVGIEASYEYFEDGLLVVDNGQISALGHASELLPTLPADIEITHYQDALITPGLIDTHIHLPQTGMVGAYGEQLLAEGTDHAGLRQMDVGIDEARCDQRILIMGDLDIGRQCWQQVTGMAERADLAVIDHQQAVFEILVRGFDTHLGGVGDAVQNGGTVGFASQRHGSSQLEA